ncbi:porin [Paraburkholderia sp. RP-4-7]|uniref:Porin n=1 Tax=Paraburkholderia polaris TaxID=2728848 RepID=A0A848I9C1_9BURK|nr:porin [Paraburkholderia polaris]NML97085.1 porin [Paraburkholderia polaris]
MVGTLLFPAAAWAQGSVTLYGTLDMGFLYTNKSLDVATGQNSGKQAELISSAMEPSVFGMQGQEDLGGGMKAKFKLESGISLANGGFDNSNENLFGRQAWVSLWSNYGEVKAGVQYSPFILALFDSDPRSMAQFGSAITVYANNTFSGTFNSNAISYTSPKIAGLTASAMYVLGGVAGDFHAGRQYSASLKYEYGGLMVNAAVDDESNSNDAAVNGSFFTQPFEGRTVGVAYRFATVNVKASFTNYKGPQMVVDGVTSGGDSNVWNIGFDYFALPELDINSGVWIVRDPHDSNNHSMTWALGTTYFLSKTTSLYAQIGVVNNHGADVYGLDRDGAQEGVKGTTMGASLGIVHKF